MLRFSQNSDSVEFNIDSKGYTILGIILLLGMLGMGLGAGYLGFKAFDSPIDNKRYVSDTWESSSPVEIEAYSTGNIGDDFVAVETVEESADSGYVKTLDNKVYWENSRGYVEVDPHTCSSFHCEHNVKITNKDTSDHDLSIAFRFPDNARNPEFYRLENVERRRPIYTEETYQEEVYNNETEQYETVERTRTVENGTETYTIEEYVDRSSVFEITQIDGQNVYYTSDVRFLSGKTQNARFEYDLTPERTENGFESSGKWELFIWKGSYDNPDWSLTLDPWFDTNFAKRKQITINNTDNSNELIDYQVFLNVTNEPTMNSDYSDLLFTWENDTSGDEQQIDFWIENHTSDYALVWVEMPEITASSTETAFVYYENSTPVTSPSNGNNTFIFFDDFEGASLNTTTWNTITPTNCAVGVSDGNMTVTWSSATSGNCRVWSKQGIPVNTKLIATKFVPDMTNPSTFGTNTIGFVENDGNTTTADDSLQFRFDGTAKAQVDQELITNDGISSNTVNANDEIPEPSVETQRMEFNWNTSDAVMFNNYTTQIATSSSNIPSIDLSVFEIIGGNGGVSYPYVTRVNYFAVANFSSPEPTATFGAEETQFGISVTLDEPTDNFINTTSSGDTPFRYTPLSLGNSTAFFINTTRYDNVTGTWEARESNNTEIINNTQISTLGAEFPDGTYIWNTEICGNDGGVQCVFADSNFTYIVDSTPPTIQIQSPTGEFNQNTSIPLNATAQDTTSGIDQFWYNIDDGTNISFTPNTTFTLAPQGNHTLKAFVNDSGGLESFNETNFSWIGTSNWTVIDADTQNPIDNVLVELDNGTVQNSDNTDSNGLVSFKWRSELPLNAVNVSFSKSGYATNETSITVDEFTLFNNTMELQAAGLEMRVFDEVTGDQLTFNVTISNSTDQVEFDSQTVLNQGIENLTRGTDVQISPVNESGGYEPRNYFEDLNAFTLVNLTAYLIKTADSVEVTFNVQDQLLNDVENAFISVSRTIDSQTVTVAQAFTDGTGTATFDLDPDVTYTIDITKDGFQDFSTTYNPSTPFQETFTLISDSGADFDTPFDDFLYRFVPRGSFVFVSNGTGSINLTTEAPGDLEYWNYTLTYNDTITLFADNRTDANGGQSNGVFNLTDSLGLSQTYNLTVNRPPEFPRTILATFTFKRTGEPQQVIQREYRITENIRGLYRLLKEIQGSETAKGLIWMVLTLILVGVVSMRLGNIGIASGMLAIMVMGVGWMIDWLPSLAFYIASFGILGLILWTRGR